MGFEDAVIVPPSWGWGKVLQRSVYALNQHLMYGTISSIHRNDRSRNQEVKVEMILFTIILSGSVAKCLLHFSMTLSSLGLKVLVPEGGNLVRRNTTIIALHQDFFPVNLVSSSL